MASLSSTKKVVQLQQIFLPCLDIIQQQFTGCDNTIRRQRSGRLTSPGQGRVPYPAFGHICRYTIEMLSPVLKAFDSEDENEERSLTLAFNIGLNIADGDTLEVPGDLNNLGF